MNSIPMLLIFGGLIFLNASIVFALIRTNLQFDSFIGWLTQKQNELLSVEKDTESLSNKMKDAITLFSFWVTQSRKLLIPIVLVAQGMVALAYMSAADGTFDVFMSVILSFVQASVIVLMVDTGSRILLSVRVVGDINQEFIKLTITDDLDEEAEGEDDTGEK